MGSNSCLICCNIPEGIPGNAGDTEPDNAGDFSFKVGCDKWVG